MKPNELFTLARIDALPIPSRLRDKLRLEEKKIGYYGALFVMLFIIVFSVLDLPRFVAGQAMIFLILSAYVVLAVSGRAMVVMLLLLSATTILVAYLPGLVSPRVAAYALVLTAPVFILSIFLTGRLQFVRACGPKWRNWPSD